MAWANGRAPKYFSQTSIHNNYSERALPDVWRTRSFFFPYQPSIASFVGSSWPQNSLRSGLRASSCCFVFLNCMCMHFCRTAKQAEPLAYHSKFAFSRPECSPLTYHSKFASSRPECSPLAYCSEFASSRSECSWPIILNLLPPGLNVLGLSF